jgi:hypothetical protein
MASIFGRDSLSSLASSPRFSLASIGGPERRRHGLGSISSDAGSIGGAALPLIGYFPRDREGLFEDGMKQAR